ncbi:MAG: DUF2202 domain-containing protein [Gemmatimonadetes bacterium]|nr:DUF2202 domain-containing protein [Gemmatimonadota bacterium]
MIRRMKGMGALPGLALATVMVFAGCGADAQATAPVAGAEDQDLMAILDAAIQDEFHAEAVYEGVLEDFGQVRPFSNIVGAEVRHSTAIATLYLSRGWSVPASAWTTDNVPHFESVGEACAVGVEAEVANVKVYDELTTGVTLPADVAQVFSSNRAASLERHLPAFQRCAT